MKKFALIACALPCAALAQVHCQVIGQFTYCSDGSSAQRIGNQVLIRPGPPTPSAPGNALIDNLTRGAAVPQIPMPQPARPAPPARPGWAPPDAVCGYDAFGRYSCR